MEYKKLNRNNHYQVKHYMDEKEPRRSLSGRIRVFDSSASNMLKPDLYLCKVNFSDKIFFKNYFEGTGNHGHESQSKLRGIIPPATQDCSTYKLSHAALLELEFHK